MGELVRIDAILGPVVAMALPPIESGKPSDKDALASVLARLRGKPCRVCGRAFRECECKTEKPKAAPTLQNLGVDAEFWGATLEDFEPECGESIRALLAHPREVRGILISGPPSRGKTRLLAASMQHAIDLGVRPKFYQTQDLFGRLQGEIDGRYALLGELADCPCLAIDDLGREGKPTEFVLSALHQIVSKRHGNFRPTIVTTNKSLAQLESQYDGAIAARIGSWLPIVMDGKDWRA